MLANTLCMVALFILIPVGGWLSDLIGRRTVLATAMGGIALVAYPLFVWTDRGTFGPARRRS